ncbi:MAG: hypothetical protein K6D59_02175 [Bacteroidales bacterium]|nr:hypothetical protein [Bacteroidales bacterium]
MKNIKSFLVFLSFAFFALSLNAQNFDYNSAWHNVDSLVKKQHYSKAYDKAYNLYQQALKSKNSHQSLVGVNYLAEIGSNFKEDSYDSSLARLRFVTPRLNPEDKAIAHLLMASFYCEYYNYNRYRILDISPIENDTIDVIFWNESRFRSEVEKELRLAFTDIAKLKATKAPSLIPLVKNTVSGNDGDLTPTLFDVMASRAVSFSNVFDFPKLKATDLSNYNNAFSFDKNFVNISVKVDDSLRSMSAFLFSLLQQRERLHMDLHSSDRVMIKLYLDRLDLLNSLLLFDNGYKDVIAQLPSVISHFRKGNDMMITDLYSRLMDGYYSLFGNDSLVAAVAIADTAVALHPKSPGAIECLNLKQRIQQPRLNVKIKYNSTSQRYSAAYLEETNLDSVFFRIVNSVEKKNKYTQKEWIAFLLKQKVVEQWNMYLADKRDYAPRKVFFAIPPLPQGDYILVASSNSAFDSLVVTSSFSVKDAVFFLTTDYGGLLLNRISGKPIANHEVLLQSKKTYKGDYVTVATARTDNLGHFNFDKSAHIVKNHYQSRFAIDYNGMRTIVYLYDESGSYDGEINHQKVFFDRPVYKPGDTVFFSLLDYLYDHEKKASVLDNQKYLCLLLDINYKTIDSLSLSTDQFGSLYGSFALPPDAMPGKWCVKYSKPNDSRDYAYFTVEAYKQPKFTVTLSNPAQERTFLKTSTVEGVAASYSAVPISGAKVSYTVTRSVEIPYWRWGWWNFKQTEPTVVAEGETVTDINGFFSISFIPTPDSNVDLSIKPSFRYKVNVKVTDLNGETHEASTALFVGMQSRYVHFGDFSSDITPIGVKNIAGDFISGSFDISLQRLKASDNPLLVDNDFPIASLEIPYSKTQMRQMFPLFNYDTATIDYKNWPLAKQYPIIHASSSPNNPFLFKKDSLPAGVYRLTASTIDNGDTVSSTTYFVNQPKNAPAPVLNDLFVAILDSSQCEVGEKLHLRVGSRFNDVSLFVLIHKDDKYYRYNKYNLSNGFIDIFIPVSDTLLGGFIVELAAIKENHFESGAFDIVVPFSHKKLDVSFSSFRDKLQPGSNETWSLVVKETKTGLTPPANLLLTMYDAALDNYSGLYYSLNLWGQDFGSSLFSFSNSLHTSSLYLLFQTPRHYSDYQYNFNIFALNNQLSYHRHDYDRILYKSLKESSYRKSRNRAASARGEDLKGLVLEISDEVNYEPQEGEVEEMEEEVLLSVVSDSDEDNDSDETSDNDELYIRQNMSTLAFFQPALRTSSDGTVTFSFTAPDLLSKWNVKGIAWTKDLKIGSINRSTVTQKKLMAVPNVPRFLRHGDTCLFSVKVSNMDDKEQNVDVSLRMTNGADGALLPMIVGDSVKKISLSPGASGEVFFRLAVPRAPVFVANYLVIARGQGVSDGEQAPIPLLPSRQLVTESMAFYINGAGKKDYELKHLSQLNADDPDFSLVNHSLTVDITPNPVWMAIQSLPYLQRLNNPSNIYLANAIYTNSLSFAIVNNNPQIEVMFKEWEKNDSLAMLSQLRLNADIKQTVIEETPWLQDAVAEEQRHRDIALFFNHDDLNKHISNDLDKLLASQRSDGGWCWIPGGSYSSLYTTQYILKIFGLLQHQGVKLDSKTRRALNRAMDFVDAETYKYYKKYIKNHGYDVVNLDYLYLRSYYPDNKLSRNQKEAYDFFYNNAKKYNESYRSLFSQAMLSVVFYRHGDKKLASEMAVRIKEKALYNDEMGMYWRDNTSGCSWSERPIETQAMLIRVMHEVLGDHESVCRMQQWILKQKQTTNWNTDVSTVSAIQALLIHDGGSDTIAPVRLKPSQMSVSFGNHTLSSDTSRYQLHVSQRLQGSEITPDDGKLTVTKADNGIAWGAMYWQYFENVEKIPASEMGVSLKKTLFLVSNNGSLSRLNNTKGLTVGDKVRVRIEITASRNLEYLELKDPRSAAMEPIDTRSGWHWNGGLSYYYAVTNAAQTLYIDRLNKGKYVVEYDMYVNNAGTYVSAPTTIQSLYAPEFRALCPTPNLFIAPRTK